MLLLKPSASQQGSALPHRQHKESQWARHRQQKGKGGQTSLRLWTKTCDWAPFVGKGGDIWVEKSAFFFLKNKYLHPIECRNLSYAGLFVTYFGTATKRKEKLFLLCTLPWHYKTKQSCTHVFAYLSQITICRTLFIQSGCNLENNQDLSTLLF